MITRHNTDKDYVLLCEHNSGAVWFVALNRWCAPYATSKSTFKNIDSATSAYMLGEVEFVRFDGVPLSADGIRREWLHGDLYQPSPCIQAPSDWSLVVALSHQGA